jgi:prolyl 4-hydroxylase
MKKSKRERELMKQDPLTYISNPLNAFLLINRLSRDVTDKIQRLVDIADTFNGRVEDIRLSPEEFHGAVEGLMRLQIMYNLQPEDLAKGIIQDKKYRDDLTSNELFAIGTGALKLQMPSISLSYLNLALTENEREPEMSDVVILESILEVHNMTDDKTSMVQTLDKILKIAPHRIDLEEIRNDLEIKQVFERPEEPEKAQPINPDEVQNGSYSALKELRHLMKACGGQQQQNVTETSKLHCRYESRTLFAKLAPFKVEEVHLNPYIAVYHDVISEEEIEIFKRYSKEVLERATVLNLNATKRVCFHGFALTVKNSDRE